MKAASEFGLANVAGTSSALRIFMGMEEHAKTGLLFIKYAISRLAPELLHRIASDSSESMPRSALLPASKKPLPAWAIPMAQRFSERTRELSHQLTPEARSIARRSRTLAALSILSERHSGTLAGLTATQLTCFVTSQLTNAEATEPTSSAWSRQPLYRSKPC
jgi:hypothetical protein